MLKQFTGLTLDELFPSRGAVENITNVISSYLSCL